MPLAQALYEHLTTSSGVSALVSTRVYPGLADDEASMPYVTFHEIANDRNYSLGGPTGLSLATYQISIFDDDMMSVRAVSEAIRNRMKLSGTMGTGGNATTVDHIELTASHDFTGAPIDADDVGTRGRMMDFEIWYRETAATGD